jgi:two-component system cell cycle response regulator DivK
MKPVQFNDSKASEGKDPRKNVILYVEDDDENWQTTDLWLCGKYNVVRAKDAQEFVQLVHTYQSNLLAILMDIQLHGSALNGLELTRLLRGELPRDNLAEELASAPILKRIPIIVMTAYAGTYSEKQIKEAGADTLLTKPVDFEKLLHLLTKLFISKTLKE